MTFQKWLDTLIEEKNWDLEATFEFTNEYGWNLMPYGVVAEAMKTAPASEQAAIKAMIVKIDFLNGDILDFFRHLGQAL